MAKWRNISFLLLFVGLLGVVINQYKTPKKERSSGVNKSNITFMTKNPIVSAIYTHKSIRHNGTQAEMPVSGEVEKALRQVEVRSIDSPSREVVRNAAMVTAFDKSHFEEAKDSVASIQTLMTPGRKIIFYDLGLTEQQAKEIKTWCNLEYRQFNFSLYPEHTRHLTYYAWKIFIILDVLKYHDAIIWFDTSIRFNCKEGIEMLALTAGSSGVAVPLTGFPSNFCYTHPGMYDYIASNLTIVQTTPMYGGGFIAIVNTKEMFTNFIEWLVRCAYTKKCMVAGTVLGCPHPNNYFTHWVGCHRYDQSAINLLLLHHFKGDIGRFTSFVCVGVFGRTGYKLSKCK